SRYGVVVRELLARETVAPSWRELVLVYRRLEARGEVRGGRLVSGLSGEQFALPEALGAPRALAGRRPDPGEGTGAAPDPPDLVGILTPGPRVPAILGHSVLYRDGVPVSQIRALG